jgi:hypothetical protein
LYPEYVAHIPSNIVPPVGPVHVPPPPLEPDPLQLAVDPPPEPAQSHV